jgi:hypothetical protein
MITEDLFYAKAKAKKKRTIARKPIEKELSSLDTSYDEEKSVRLDPEKPDDEKQLEEQNRRMLTLKVARTSVFMKKSEKLIMEDGIKRGREELEELTKEVQEVA